MLSHSRKKTLTCSCMNITATNTDTDNDDRHDMTKNDLRPSFIIAHVHQIHARVISFLLHSVFYSYGRSRPNKSPLSSSLLRFSSSLRSSESYFLFLMRTRIDPPRYTVPIHSSRTRINTAMIFSKLPCNFSFFTCTTLRFVRRRKPAAKTTFDTITSNQSIVVSSSVNKQIGKREGRTGDTGKG